MKLRLCLIAATLLLGSVVCFGQAPGIPGHIVRCPSPCIAGTVFVKNNDDVTILKWVTDNETLESVAYFQTEDGQIGVLPSYQVARGPARDAVEIGTYMVLSLLAACGGIWWFWRLHKKDQKPAAAAVALILFCGISGFSQTADGFQPQKLHLPHTTAAPLGFARGMTKEQIVALVGKDNVAATDPNDMGGVVMYLRTAPKPYSAFSDYIVEISPTQGLLNVEAIGKPIDTSEDGSELRSEYIRVKDQLQLTYADPATDEDSLKPGSLYQEQHYFMLGMVKKDRQLLAYWGQPVNGSIETIFLKANAKDLTTGFITLTYSFVGWHEYYEQLKSKEGSVL